MRSGSCVTRVKTIKFMCVSFCDSKRDECKYHCVSLYKRKFSNKTRGKLVAMTINRGRVTRSPAERDMCSKILDLCMACLNCQTHIV